MTTITEYELTSIAEAVIKEIEKKYFLVKKSSVNPESIPLQFKLLEGAKQFISQKHAITTEQLCSVGKTKEFSQARMEYCFLVAKHFPEISLHKIGSVVNIKHCTVIHAKKTIQDRLDVMRGYKTIIDDYMKEFPGYIEEFVKNK